MKFTHSKLLELVNEAIERQGGILEGYSAYFSQRTYFKKYHYQAGACTSRIWCRNNTNSILVILCFLKLKNFSKNCPNFNAVEIHYSNSSLEYEVWPIKL